MTTRSSDGGVEEVVDVVGNVNVVQGSGMGVVAQGGGGVSVAEPSLSFEDLALTHQLGGDAVAALICALVAFLS